MTRIRFEDLPSRNTPRNAENLNKLNNVVISPTEPTTGEEVWIKKGKNLLNKNDLTENYYLDYINGAPTWDSNMAYMNSYIPVEPNTEYTMSANAGTIFVIYEYDENKNFIGYKSQNTEAASYTMTTEETTKYVRLALGKSMKDVMQFQQGAATEYEEYIDKEIYVKNDNGVYELFNKVEEPQYCQVQISGNRILKVASQYEKVVLPFDKIVTQSGDFSPENGGIKIGKNISRIKVTANIQVNSISNEGMFAVLLRVGEVGKAYPFFKLKAFQPVTFTYVIDVKENDNVNIAFQNQETFGNEIKLFGTSNYVTTSMLIEKIA